MKNTNLIRQTRFLVTSICILTMVTACGGGDDKCEAHGLFSLFVCLTGVKSKGDPEQIAVQTAASNDPATTMGAKGIDNATSTIMQVAEYEPNNSLDNANVVSLPSSPAGTSTGVAVNGSTKSGDDPSDYFIFAPNRSGSYNISLCADLCTEILEDDSSYIMIYDQYQTTIAATPIGTVARQEVSVELTAGVAYYVEVHGYNTGGISLDYKMVIAD